MSATAEPNSRKRWSAFNLTAMIIGFVVFWPVGIFLLVWILMNRDVKELPDILGRLFQKIQGWFQNTTQSGNRIFDEYQQTQKDRIDEIKAEIRERESAFQEFKEEQRRAADQEEFQEFMRRTPQAEGGA